MGTIGRYTTAYQWLQDAEALYLASLKEEEPAPTATVTVQSTPVPPPPPLQPIRTAGGDLSFTNAGYGGAIPLVFGADKVTGTVIWASPIVTNQIPVNNQYVQFQSVDFALALCEGPIEGILRMWLGDRLIYDSTMSVDGTNAPTAGSTGAVDTRTVDITDPLSPLSTIPVGERKTQITLFNGAEEQLPYGVMVTAEGIDNTPAYRGVSYVLFENFVTAGTDTPTIVVEIAANTAGFYPRVSSSPTGTPLTTVQNDALYVNEAWGQVYYHAEDGGTGNGLIGVNLNTFEQETNVEYNDTFFGGANLLYNKGLVVSQGSIIIHSGVGNPGTVCSINPLAGAGADTLGPNGGLSIDANGFSTLVGDMCTVPGINKRGDYVDFVFVVNDSSDGLGFFIVDEYGSMEMGSYQNSFFPADDTKIEFLNVNGYRYGINPTWVTTGETTYGNYLIYFSEADPETVEWDVGYVRLGGPDPNNPEDVAVDYALTRYSTGTLDFNEFGGRGEVHEIMDIVRLPDEGLILLFIKTSSPLLPDWIAKYNPYTNSIVWKTSTKLDIPARFTFQRRADLRGAQQYCWVSNNVIYAINLATGRIKTLISNIITDQGLPASFAGGSMQYYNGTENSLIYMSAGQLNKVYLERTAVGITSVPVILSALFKRIGVTEADLAISDVNALNLRGYTLTEVSSLGSIIQTLRQIFTFDIIESNGRLKYISRGGTSAATIENKWLQDVAGEGGYLTYDHGVDIAELRKINITYRDIDREYMENVQNIYYPAVESVGFDQDAGIQVTTPIVLTATESRYIADKLLYSKRVNEVRLTAVVPFRFAWLDPGDVVTVNIDDAGTDTVQCRIVRQTITRDMNVELELVREDVDIYNEDPGFGGVIGRFWRVSFPPLDPLYRPHYIPVTNMDAQYSVSLSTGNGVNNKWHFVLLDLLRTSEDVANSVSLLVDVQLYANWQQRLDQLYNPPRGWTWNPDAPIYAEPTWKTPRKVPTWGFLTTAPAGATSPYTPREDNSMTIRIMNERASFPFQNYTLYGEGEWYSEWNNTDAGAPLTYYETSASLLQGAENTVNGNLIAVGSELMRFRSFTDNGNGTYTLNGIVRGVCNTEHACEFTTPGDICVLLRLKDGRFDTEAVGDFYSGYYSYDDTLNTADWYARYSQNYTATKAPVTNAELTLVTNNPRQPKGRVNVAPWHVLSPAGHNILADYDGTGNVDISWTRRSPYTRAMNLGDFITPTVYTRALGTWNEYLDDGDEAAQNTVWMGFNASNYYGVLATQQLREDFQTQPQPGFLRTFYVENGTSFEYTTAMQTADGFDSDTDTLYMYIWAQHPVFTDGFRQLKPHKLRPLG